jgi:hypothetical protein
VAPANPPERFLRRRGPGVFDLVDEEVLVRLFAGVALTPDRTPLFALRLIAQPAVFQFVRHGVFAKFRLRIERAPRLEHAHLHPRLAQFLRGPTARRARTDDDDVVDFLFHPANPML